MLACLEPKNLVDIIFANGVDINKFVTNQAESYILKEGVRTTTIRPVGKREISVTVFGLHPDTRDEAVIQYLNAHGQVNKKDPVVCGVYPGAPGSTMLAGKQNGNCSYMVEVKRNLGTYHIIDGEKVTVKYRGQTKTCAKCHQSQFVCPGKGLAKDCSADRVLLSEHMKNHWKSINFKPNTTEMHEVDVPSDDEICQVSASEVKPAEATVTEPAPGILEKCTGVVIPGVKQDMEEFTKCSKNWGLPEEFGQEDLHFKENRKSKTVYIHDLKPEVCLKLIKNMHGKEFADKKLLAYTLVEDTPSKKTSPTEDSVSATKPDERPKSTEDSVPAIKPDVRPKSKFWSVNLNTASDTDDSNTEYDTSCEQHDTTAGFIFEKIKENLKRKAGASRNHVSPTLTRKEQKIQRRAAREANPPFAIQ